MTIEFIIASVATAFIVAAVAGTYRFGPARREPFVVELLNATFGRGSPLGDETDGGAGRSAPADSPRRNRSHRENAYVREIEHFRDVAVEVR